MLLVFHVVIPGPDLGNSQVSVNRTIGPTLVVIWQHASNYPPLLYTQPVYSIEIKRVVIDIIYCSF